MRSQNVEMLNQCTLLPGVIRSLIKPSGRLLGLEQSTMVLRLPLMVQLSKKLERTLGI